MDTVKIVIGSGFLLKQSLNLITTKLKAGYKKIVSELWKRIRVNFPDSYYIWSPDLDTVKIVIGSGSLQNKKSIICTTYLQPALCGYDSVPVLQFRIPSIIVARIRRRSKL